MFAVSRLFDPLRTAVGPALGSPAPVECDIAGGMLWARLTVAGEDRACFVSRVTNFGAMLRVSAKLAVGEAVTLHLRNTPPIAATVRAIDAGRVRLGFSRPFELAPLLGTPAFAHLGVPSSRYRANVSGRFRLGTMLAQVKVLDISQGGAKLELGETVDIDQQGLLNFPGAGRPLAGRVRWCHSGRAGIQFVEPLAKTDLDCMLDFIRATNGAEAAATLR